MSGLRPRSARHAPPQSAAKSLFSGGTCRRNSGVGSGDRSTVAIRRRRSRRRGRSRNASGCSSVSESRAGSGGGWPTSTRPRSTPSCPKRPDWPARSRPGGRPSSPPCWRTSTTPAPKDSTGSSSRSKAALSGHSITPTAAARPSALPADLTVDEAVRIADADAPSAMIDPVRSGSFLATGLLVTIRHPPSALRCTPYANVSTPPTRREETVSMVDTPFIPEDAETRPLPVPSRGHIGLVVPGGIASVVDRQASRGVRS